MVLRTNSHQNQVHLPKFGTERIAQSLPYTILEQPYIAILTGHSNLVFKIKLLYQ